jgi:hypothetical protein
MVAACLKAKVKEPVEICQKLYAYYRLVDKPRFVTLKPTKARIEKESKKLGDLQPYLKSFWTSHLVEILAAALVKKGEDGADIITEGLGLDQTKLREALSWAKTNNDLVEFFAQIGKGALQSLAIMARSAVSQTS